VSRLTVDLLPSGGCRLEERRTGASLPLTREELVELRSYLRVERYEDERRICGGKLLASDARARTLRNLRRGGVTLWEPQINLLAELSRDEARDLARFLNKTPPPPREDEERVTAVLADEAREGLSLPALHEDEGLTLAGVIEVVDEPAGETSPPAREDESPRRKAPKQRKEVKKIPVKSKQVKVDGEPVRKGDLLYSRKGGTRVTVAGFKNDPERGRLVRLKPEEGKERVVKLASVARAYER
jgi:hypothetical protein